MSPRGENRGVGDRSIITNEPRSDLLAPMYGLNLYIEMQCCIWSLLYSIGILFSKPFIPLSLSWSHISLKTGTWCFICLVASSIYVAIAHERATLSHVEAGG